MSRLILVLGVLLIVFGFFILIPFPIIGVIGILFGILFIIIDIASEEETRVPPPPVRVKPKTEDKKTLVQRAEKVKEEGKMTAPGYIYCPYCGEQIPKKSKFCPNCGAALD